MCMVLELSTHLNQSMDGWGMVIYYYEILVVIGAYFFYYILLLLIWNMLYNWKFRFKLWYSDFILSRRFPSIYCLLFLFPQYSEIEHNGCKLFNDIPSGHNSGFKVTLFLNFEVEINSSQKIRKKLVYWKIIDLLQPCNSVCCTMVGVSLKDVIYFKESQ